MDLTASDIRALTALGREVARAPGIEIVSAAAFETLRAVCRVEQVRTVSRSGPGSWTEWTAEAKKVRARALKSFSKPRARGCVVFFDENDATAGFVSASPNTPRLREALELIKPQIWAAAVLRMTLDRTARSAVSESGIAHAAMLARDDERRRIANELHDDFGQQLASLRINLKWVEDKIRVHAGLEEAAAELAGIRESTGAMMEKIRDLSHTLYPRILDTLGLVSAVKELAHYIRSHTPLDVSCVVEGRSRQVPKDAALALYRCGQEALNNALRHSDASAIRIAVTFSREGVCLKVQDNGKGFDPRKLYASGAKIMSSGFWTIRQRITPLGGAFRINTARGRGTTVETIVPFSTERTHARR
jgi:signal transduction histidine kinase